VGIFVAKTQLLRI